MVLDAAITAHEVRKHYRGDKTGAGLDRFDLEVARGTVCGLLGPNGAGKTTAIRILTTLLRMDAGRASVAGFDVATQGRDVRKNIGLVGQYAAVDEILSGRQNLELFGRLNHLPARKARAKADELLERFALTEARDKSVATYSGGMRRRLDLAASLVVTPPVLFVDEPTTGLDPAARQEVWTAIGALVKSGTTVLLTTQYLEEADQLADRITMLAKGRVVAEGTPDALKSAYGSDWLDVALPDATHVAKTRQILEGVAKGADLHVDEVTHRLSAPVADRTRALVEAATALSAAGIEPDDITLRRPTLNEVFLHLVDAPEEVSA